MLYVLFTTISTSLSTQQVFNDHLSNKNQTSFLIWRPNVVGRVSTQRRPCENHRFSPGKLAVRREAVFYFLYFMGL